MITIHYTGKSDLETMQKLVAELIEISNELEWENTIIDDEKFFGIILSIHEKCEPLSFVIDKNGNLINPVWLNEEKQTKLAYINSTKTNFSTIDVHISIVKLLKYIQKKYIHNLKVIDEGEYYLTEDRDLLTKNWNFMNEKFNEISTLLEKDSDTLENSADLLSKIIEILKNRFNDDNKE